MEKHHDVVDDCFSMDWKAQLNFLDVLIGLLKILFDDSLSGQTFRVLAPLEERTSDPAESLKSTAY